MWLKGVLTVLIGGVLLVDIVVWVHYLPTLHRRIHQHRGNRLHHQYNLRVVVVLLHNLFALRLIRVHFAHRCLLPFFFRVGVSNLSLFKLLDILGFDPIDLIDLDNKAGGAGSIGCLQGGLIGQVTALATRLPRTAPRLLPLLDFLVACVHDLRLFSVTS